MQTPSPFVILRKPCDEAVVWATLKLEQIGFRIIRTFDLQSARLAHLDCPCPNHGTGLCNCQMVVLLVYQGDTPPTALVVHGNDETSWFYLIDKQHSNEQPLEKYIQAALNLEINAKA